MNERQASELTRFIFVSAGSTDKGRTRKNNEDSFVVDGESGLYAVADGIGGHAGGEVASRLAVQSLLEFTRVPPAETGIPEVLDRAYKAANARILEAGTDPALSGMGTTLTALLFHGAVVHLAHVGDSRAYLLRNGELKQVSEDHGLVAEQVRAGIVTPEQARRSPYRHVITRALGIDRDVQPDHSVIEIMRQDVFLLCTDGLTEMVEDHEIGAILATASPDQAVERLIAAANGYGGVDNISVVVVKVEPGP